MLLSPATRFQGRVTVPGDKSISHRALLLSALAGGGRIRGLADGEDVRATRECLLKLGVGFAEDNGTLVVSGGIVAREATLDCANSGSTMRLLMGVLAGRPGTFTLTGDASLSRRPMDRVAVPLTQMGARIRLRDERFAPVVIEGRPLHGARYALPVASAQVKTALLLAGISAEGETVLEGELASRDHTERMLPHFGVALDAAHPLRVTKTQLRPAEVWVPGDPSSAAFWAAAAAIVPGGDVTIENVSLNPTRTGFLRALRSMGAEVEEIPRAQSPEPFGDVRVRYRELLGITVRAEDVPAMVDELPLLAVVGAFAQSPTSVTGAAELRVKESDRIEAIARNLRTMGGTIETLPDGFRVQGRSTLRGAALDAEGDHRIAMAFAVAALRAQGVSQLDGAASVAVSYPSFFATLEKLASVETIDGWVR